MKRFSTLSLFVLSFALALPSLAAAQATRTWVSGVGDDANPCSRTAPCKTFQGAISKTAAKGEISVLDPAGYGAVTITKSITISGDGTLASILTSAGSAITINAGASDAVIIRSLSFEGLNSATNGIRFLNGGSLVVENSNIHAFATGIDINTSSAVNVLVRNTMIMGGTTGVHVNGSVTSTQLRVSLDNVTIQGTNNGVDTLVGTTMVSNSNLTQNSGAALWAEGGAISADRTTMTANGIAVLAHPGATIRLSNSQMFDNLTGIGCGGGYVQSSGNNLKAGNVGGPMATCAPNGAISVQ